MAGSDGLKYFLPSSSRRQHSWRCRNYPDRPSSTGWFRREWGGHRKCVLSVGKMASFWGWFRSCCSFSSFWRIVGTINSFQLVASFLDTGSKGMQGHSGFSFAHSVYSRSLNEKFQSLCRLCFDLMHQLNWPREFWSVLLGQNIFSLLHRVCFQNSTAFHRLSTVYEHY